MRPAAGFSRRPSTLINLRDIHQLIDECDASLRADPACLHTLAIHGYACMKAKLWDAAIRDFSEILKCRPEDIHGQFSRGMAFFKNGQIESALMDFSRVLELNPHHVMARYARAGCYNTEGEFHEAILDYTIALEHDEKEHESAFRIEKPYRRGGNGLVDTLGHLQQRHHHHQHGSATAGITTAHSTQSPDPIHFAASSPTVTEQNALQAPGPIFRDYTTRFDDEPKLNVETSYSSQPRSAEAPQAAVSSSSHSFVAAQPASRVPRKVVQVRVNLSEFADASTNKTPIETLSSMASSKPIGGDPQRVVRVQAQDPTVAPAAIAVLPETAPRFVAPIPSVNPVTTPAPQKALVRPLPSRAIRKVTVTL